MNSSDKASLVRAAIYSTILMFLIGVAVNVPGTAASLFVYIVCMPAIVVLLLFGVFALGLRGTCMLHKAIMECEDREDALRQKKADRNDYYQHNHDRRELELKQNRQPSYHHQIRIKRCARHLRHLKRRRKDD